MPTRPHLVMIETNGNQRFIFDAPRLRDAVGASALLTRLESWTRAAEPALPKCEDPEHAAPELRDARAPNWVSAVSGKVIFTVKTEQDARRVISEVTRRALTDAPGMDICGVFTELQGPEVAQNDLDRIHSLAAQYGLDRSPVQARFPQLPFLERAKDSALPASPRLGIAGEAKDDQGDQLSLPARVKRHSAYSRRRELLTRAMEESALLKHQEDRLVRDPTKLEEALRRAFLDSNTGTNTDPQGNPDTEPESDEFSEDQEILTRIEQLPTLSKVAVIHIDGNGVGAVMRNLKQAMDRVPETILRQARVVDERANESNLRLFLLSVTNRLAKAAVGAFAHAWARVSELASLAGPVPVVPVILGGDDVTVITSGDYALPFAAEYLREYEKRTGHDPVLKYLGAPDDGSGGTGPMTAAAGVAVVRRNFPFHIAYDLAEDLVRRGKRIGKTMSPVCSTLDFHVLLDSTVTDPADTLSAYAEYTTRPYLFGANAERGANDSRNSTWDAVCARVHNFAVIPGGDGGPFPRTRAARIVKLLAEGKHHQGGEGNDRSDSHPVAVTGTDVTADVEWKIAEETVLSNAPLKDLLGGPEALFDLCQLADLLPEAYLDSALDVDAPAETPALAEATENAKE